MIKIILVVDSSDDPTQATQEGRAASEIVRRLIQTLFANDLSEEEVIEFICAISYDERIDDPRAEQLVDLVIARSLTRKDLLDPEGRILPLLQSPYWNAAFAERGRKGGRIRNIVQRLEAEGAAPRSAKRAAPSPPAARTAAPPSEAPQKKERPIKTLLSNRLKHLAPDCRVALEILEKKSPSWLGAELLATMVRQARPGVNKSLSPGQLAEALKVLARHDRVLHKSDTFRHKPECKD